jgi:hypothetical protein
LGSTRVLNAFNILAAKLALIDINSIKRLTVALSVGCHEGWFTDIMATFANPNCAPLPLGFLSIVRRSPSFAD